MDYYDTKNKIRMTQFDLARRGLPQDIKALAFQGVYPIRYEAPAFNANFYTSAPAEITLENGFAVQHFDVVPLPLDTAKKNLRDAVTARRWQAETGGIDVAGVRVLTGVDDQNRISTAIQGVRDAGIAEVDFKASSGWVKLTLDQLIGIAGAIAEHVQACFSKERELHEAVDAAQDVEELADLDIEHGWPNEFVEETPAAEESAVDGETPNESNTQA